MFVAWASTVNVAYPDLFDKAEASATPMEHDTLSANEVRLSRALLTMSMARHAPEGKGLEI